MDELRRRLVVVGVQERRAVCPGEGPRGFGEGIRRVRLG